jgi:hypothetical protein
MQSDVRENAPVNAENAAKFDPYTGERLPETPEEAAARKESEAQVLEKDFTHYLTLADGSVVKAIGTATHVRNDAGEILKVVAIAERIVGELA